VKTVPIGEITERVSTWNPIGEPEAEFTYVDLSAVDNLRKAITAPVAMTGREAPSRARQLIKTDDVLVSTVRPNLNAVALVGRDIDGATASTGFTVLRPTDRVDAKYLFHWVRTPQFVAGMVRKATGASYPAVSDRIVKESLIPLPPLAEQQRIAAILDKADELRDVTCRARQNVDLAKAGVTRRFFAEQSTADWYSLESATEKVVVGHVGPTTEYFTTSGVPFLRTGNVGDGEILSDDIAEVTPEFHSRLGKSQLMTGDVLISRVISDRVRAAILPPELDGANCANIIVVRPSNTLLAEVITGYLNLPETQHALLGRKVGSAQSVVNTSVLKSLSVPVPGAEEQRRFRELSRELDLLRAKFVHSDRTLLELFASVQSRAFSGTP
jgi:type I restriction enzyme S subunit